MGGLLSLVGSTAYEEVDLTLSSSPPNSPNEEKAFNRVGEVMAKTPHSMKSIEDYTGCQQLARAAMNTPSPENEKAAFEGLLVAVDSIATFFSLTKELEVVLPELLTTMAMGSEEKTAGIPEALGTQLAQIFEFSLEFDRVRMLRPHLSNDFSYYRRLLPKFSKHPDLKIKDDEASGMALFTAEHIPMMNCMIKGSRNAQEKNPQVSRVLAILANSCRKALFAKKFTDPAIINTCVRAMTAAIVIFDHIDIISVFHKKSPINIKACVALLKREEFKRETSLLNAIRYSTAHFNDAPQSVQDLFD